LPGDRIETDALGRGDYVLATTGGGAFTEDTLKGAPSAVFFGFAQCPEVCPTTLADIDYWNAALVGEGLAPLRAFFVTVDPERDSLEMMDDYVTRATGVTGSVEEVTKAMHAFRIYARKQPLKGGDYTMDHSAMVLLFDADGRPAGTIAYREEPEQALDKFRRLVSS
jgi:protein SCO1/2